MTERLFFAAYADDEHGMWFKQRIEKLGHVFRSLDVRRRDRPVEIEILLFEGASSQQHPLMRVTPEELRRHGMKKPNGIDYARDLIAVRPLSHRMDKPLQQAEFHKRNEAIRQALGWSYDPLPQLACVG